MDSRLLEKKISLQIEKITLWIETISMVVV